MAATLEITAYWESASGVPLISPINTPTIRIRQIDTTSLVVTDAAMTEVGDGVFHYKFDPPVVGKEYSARADGDPFASGQVPATIRFQAAVFTNRLREIWRTLGADPDDPVTITNETILSDSSAINIALSGDGVSSKRMVRST